MRPDVPTDGGGAGPVSILIPAYEAARTMSDCLRSVLSVRYAAGYEVVVVASGPMMATFAFPSDPRLRVIRSNRRLSAAAARNRAVAVASFDQLCFTDADVIVPPDWLDRLTAASEGGTVAVAGSVENGTPTRHAGSVEYYLEFMDIHPGRPANTSWHGATCNLLVPRALWTRFGPFPEGMGGGEDTLLSVRMREVGAFRFEPTARVLHQNRTAWLAVFRHQVQFGRFTSRLARQTSYRWRLLVRTWVMAPVAAAARVVSIYLRIALWSPEELPRAAARLPVVVVMVTGWAIGLTGEGIALDYAGVRAASSRLMKRFSRAGHLPSGG